MMNKQPKGRDSLGLNIADQTRQRRSDPCFGSGRAEEEECFGVRYGGTIVGILIGAFVIIVGLGLFLEQDITRFIGPFVVVVFGALIVAGSIFALRRSRRS